MDTKPAHCPFCGEDGSVLKYGSVLKFGGEDGRAIFAACCDAAETCGAMITADTEAEVLARWNRRDDTIDLGDLGRVRSVRDEEAAAMMGITVEELRARLEEALAEHPEGSKMLDEVRAARAKKGSGLQ